MPRPPTDTHSHTLWTKSWSYVDFNMAPNEYALTQPKFELGICAIIQNVFQGDKTTKQKKWKIVGNKLIIFHKRGAGQTGLLTLSIFYLRAIMGLINISKQTFILSLESGNHDHGTFPTLIFWFLEIVWWFFDVFSLKWCYFVSFWARNMLFT